jgi:hypothetical protein
MVDHAFVTRDGDQTRARAREEENDRVRVTVRWKRGE